MSEEGSKIVNLADFYSGDPGDEQPEAELLSFPADEEGGTIEVTIEEVLAGFAQGMEILRLGLIEAFTRIDALEGGSAEDIDLDDASIDEAAEAELDD